MIKETKMKRLCIYVTYNPKNQIQEYTAYLLKALRECCTKLYVVCNYPEISRGKQNILPFVDGIFSRENKGYDAGAYKDMLCTLIGWDEVYQYDELILTNDSFLGPFFDMNKYFEMMSKEGCDFWGMTRQFGGELEPIGYHYQSLVQSYFFVFRSQVMHSSRFRAFWEDFAYPDTFIGAVLNYEVRINEYLERYGFVSKALTDAWGMVFAEGKMAYMHYLFELIRDKKFPVLKKKSLLVRNSGLANVLKAVELIEMKTLYPVQWIKELLDNQFYIEGYAPENEDCLEYFYKRFKKVYIYGAGVCGKNLTVYFDYKGWKYAGVLVSDKANQGMECEAFDDILVDDETGIIISVVHRNISEEIVRFVGSRCKKEQLFVLYDCLALREDE